MADPTDRAERDARFLAFCEQAGDPGGSMLAAGHAYQPRKESETMADPTDDRPDPLAPCTDHGCLLRTERSKGMGTNGGCRCLTGSPIEVRQVARRLAADRRKLAEENARLREALRAADELAEAVEAGHHDSCRRTGDGTECDGCVLPERVAAYRAARGER